MWTLLLALLPAALAVELPDPLAPDAYLSAVLDHSPTLAAADAEIEASTAAVSTARGPAHDPMLRAQLVQIRLDQPPGWQADVSWELEPARAVRVAAAVAELERARAARENERERLEIEAMETWARWAAASAERAALDEQQALANASLGVATAALSAGRGELGAVQDAQIVLGTLLTRRDEVEAAFSAASAELNNLLHRPPETELPPPDLGALPNYVSGPGMHPEMRLAAAERAAAQAELHMVSAAANPRPAELMAGIGMEMMPEHSLMGMAGVTFAVPVGGRARAERDEAAARLKLAEAEIGAMSQEMRTESNDDQMALSAAMARERALREVELPQAELRVAALQASVSAGMDALPMLLMASRELSELRAEHAAAVAELWPLALRVRQSRGAPAILE